LATFERVARSAETGGLLAVASALFSFVIFAEWEGAATPFRLLLPVALLLTPLSGLAGMVARVSLRRRPISDRCRRAAINATTLAFIATGLLFLLAVGIPSSKTAVRHLRTTTPAPPELANTP
jgi:hypothetical protein